MDNNYYNKLILSRVEKSFNIVLPIGAFVAIASAVAISFSEIDLLFAYVDIGIAVLLLVMYLMRDALATEVKVLITIAIPIALGILTFSEGGFASGTVTLMLISNAIAVLFLTKLLSRTIAGLTVVTFVSLWRWSINTGFEPSIMTSDSMWVIQLLLFLLFIVIFHIAIYAIRSYLFENIIQLEEAVSMTTQLAYFDQLTGLPNQFKLKELLNEKVKDPRCKGYLIFLSYKNLNMINTIHGDQIGDEVLLRTAVYLKSIQSEGDLVGRSGGNEFALWLTAESHKELKHRLLLLGEGFHNKIDLPEVHNKLEYYISYARYDHVKADISQTYHHTTLAMTYAKYKGESNIVPYDEKFEQHLREEDKLKVWLKEAVKKNHFKVYYQTKVDGESHQVVGVEALARWEIEGYGYVSPAVFVPLVEDLNLAIPFGRLIVSRVMSDYQDICHKYGAQVKVSINISPSFLSYQGFNRFINEAMSLNKVPANKVILEITEEVAINGSATVNTILAPIRTIGVQISLDDFGTGYSSLNYLTTLMVDELKIDKSFIDRLVEDKKTQILLSAIIQLSSEYKLAFVAEGVETKEQHDQLLAMGCKIIQGYYYAKPEPL